MLSLNFLFPKMESATPFLIQLQIIWSQASLGGSVMGGLGKDSWSILREYHACQGQGHRAWSSLYPFEHKSWYPWRKSQQSEPWKSPRFPPSPHFTDGETYQ